MILAFCYEVYIISRIKAGVAQLAEQLTCNQQVVGSTPITSSINIKGLPRNR